MERNFIETYDTEEEALRQIEQLKDEGYSESDMYIMTRNDDQLSMIQGKTNVDNYAEQGNWMDRFTSFLTGDKQMETAFRSMQLSRQEEERYYREVKAGKLLLYVNKDYEARFREAGGDSFKLGEKDKTELQNRKKQSENITPSRIGEEEAVTLMMINMTAVVRDLCRAVKIRMTEV